MPLTIAPRKPELPLLDLFDLIGLGAMMNPCSAVENLEDRANQSNSRPTQAVSNQQSHRLLMFKGDAGVCEKKLGASVL
jgi:hypothetical protein